MAAVPHEPSKPLREKRTWSLRGLATEMWAALAITMMWLAVLFTALFGPDFVSTSAGGNMTRIPSGIAVAIFAYLGTRVVAKHGFGRSRPGSD